MLSQCPSPFVCMSRPCARRIHPVLCVYVISYSCHQRTINHDKYKWNNNSTHIVHFIFIICREIGNNAASYLFRKTSCKPILHNSKVNNLLQIIVIVYDSQVFTSICSDMFAIWWSTNFCIDSCFSFVKLQLYGPGSNGT